MKKLFPALAAAALMALPAARAATFTSPASAVSDFGSLTDVSGASPTTGQAWGWDGSNWTNLNVTASNTNAAGGVIVYNPDGTATPYLPSADTDAARGEAYTNAVNAAPSESLLSVSPGGYDVVGYQFITNKTLTIMGAGKLSTVIYGDSVATPGLIHIQDLSRVYFRDLTISNENASAIGMKNDEYVSFEDCRLFGVGESIVVGGNYLVGSGSEMYARNSYFYAGWDNVSNFSTNGVVTLVNCDVVTESQPSLVFYKTCVNNNGAGGQVFNVYGGSLTCSSTNAAESVKAVDVAAGTMNLYGVKIQYGEDNVSANNYLLNQSAGTLSVSGSHYDVSETFGTITYTDFKANDLLSSSLNLSGLTASRGLGLNGNGDVTNLTATTTELNYNSGLTNNVQDQLNTLSNKITVVGDGGGITVETRVDNDGNLEFGLTDDDAGGGSTTNFAMVSAGHVEMGSQSTTNGATFNGANTYYGTLTFPVYTANRLVTLDASQQFATPTGLGYNNATNLTVSGNISSHASIVSNALTLKAGLSVSISEAPATDSVLDITYGTHQNATLGANTNYTANLGSDTNTMYLTLRGGGSDYTVGFMGQTFTVPANSELRDVPIFLDYNGATNISWPFYDSDSLALSLDDEVGSTGGFVRRQFSYVSGGTSPLVLDLSAPHTVMITNSVSAALTIVLTNIAEGAWANVYLPADGTGRALSIVPQVGTSTNWLTDVNPTQTADLNGMLALDCFTHATGTNVVLSYSEQ